MWPRKVKQDERITVYRCIAEGLKSGVSLPDVLDAVSEEEVASPRMASALREVAVDLRRGVPFREALSKHPGAVPPEHAEILAAAEEGGALEGALRDLADHVERMWTATLWLWSSIIYPALVAVYALGIFWLIFSFVVPRFVELTKELGVEELPLLTKVGLLLAKVAPYVAAFVVWAVVFVAIVVAILRKFRGGRKLLARLSLLVPGMGRGALLAALARYAAALGLLVRNGVPDLRALRLAPRFSGNEMVREAGERVASEVERGRTLVEAFGAVGLFPHSMRVAVSATSKGVPLSSVMEGLSRIYIEQSNSIMKRFMRALEPALIIAIGIIVFIGLGAAWSPILHIIRVLAQGG